MAMPVARTAEGGAERIETRLTLRRLCFKIRTEVANMTHAAEELERMALELSEEERAHMAASMLDSLPGILTDSDEGVAEALRRDAELDANPEMAITLEQLDAAVIRNRRK